PPVALAPADLPLLGEGALGARLEAGPAPAPDHAAGPAPVRWAAAHGREAVHDAGARDGRAADRRFDRDHRRSGGAVPGAVALPGGRWRAGACAGPGGLVRRERRA